MRETLKAPFPYFGGKSAVAGEVWRGFGTVRNYVEPFCGSLAVLLARPGGAVSTETVNDADGLLTNFWRAVKRDAGAVAEWADYPVSEIDLLARHAWLARRRAEITEAMKASPDYFDVQAAGWWVWGACAWIGQGWGDGGAQLPHLGDAGRGLNRKLPHLGDAGRGRYIRESLDALALRLRDTRIACGDWRRVLGPSVTHRHGLTGIFFDPPYGEGAMDYAAGGNATGIAQDVADWCAEHGDNPLLRIVYAGYEGAVTLPDSWRCVAWKNRGGYGSQGDGDGRKNARRERLWFSPHCLDAQPSLFGSRPVLDGDDRA